MLIYNRCFYIISRTRFYINCSFYHNQSRAILGSKHFYLYNQSPNYFKPYSLPVSNYLNSPIYTNFIRYNQNDQTIKRPLKQDDRDENDQTLSKWDRFKIMAKKYWYVLIPVHAITTVIWLGSFWYAAKCGVDVVPLLKKLGLPDTIIEPLQKSGASYIAIAYAMYKIITPIRYAITLGGTTIAIKYLRKYGYIKPMPSSQQIKKMVRTLREERIKRFRKKNHCINILKYSLSC